MSVNLCGLVPPLTTRMAVNFKQEISDATLEGSVQC